MSKSQPISEALYRWLPLAPIVLLFVMGIASFLRWQQNTTMLDSKIESFFGVPRSEVTFTSLRSPEGDDKGMRRLLSLIRAKSDLEREYGLLSYLLGDGVDEQIIYPPDQPWPVEPIVDRFIVDAQPIFTELSALLDEHDSLSLPVLNEGEQTNLHEWQSLRELSRILRTEFAAAFHDGEMGRAVHAVALTYGLFDRLDSDQALVCQLIKNSTIRQMVNAVVESLQYDLWSDQQLHELGSLIGSYQLNLSDVEESYRTETYFVLCGDARESRNQMPAILADGIVPPSTPLNYLNRLEAAFDAWPRIAAADLKRRTNRREVDTSSVRRRSLERFRSDDVSTDDLEDIVHTPAFSIDQWLASPVLINHWRYLRAAPSLELFTRLLRQQRFDLNLAKTALAVRKYRHAKGIWPETLQQLTSFGLTMKETVDPFGNPIELTPMDDALEIRFREYYPNMPDQHLVKFSPVLLMMAAKTKGEPE